MRSRRSKCSSKPPTGGIYAVIGTTTGRFQAFFVMTSLVGLVTCFYGCSENTGASKPVPEPSDGIDEVARATQRAEQAASRLLGQLVSELSAALSAGPPHTAVDVCGQAAQRVTQEAAEREKLSMRRVALRFRNPKNSPDEYEKATLEKWIREGDVPQHHSEVVDLEGGGRELRYLRPIMLKPLCTACHGRPPEISSQTREAIQERYPNDLATGFRPGELRGAVSIRVALDG